jgi:hypothetical protein
VSPFLNFGTTMATLAPDGVPTNPVNPNVDSATAAQPITPDNDGNSSTTDGAFIEQTPLTEISVACLIINKMIGTGIYTTPGIVLLLCGNKILALFLWLFGGLYSYLRFAIPLIIETKTANASSSIYIYLEYGLAWPYNGGEFFYVGL